MAMSPSTPTRPSDTLSGKTGKAAEFILAGIESGRFAKGEFLPSVHACAKMAGVSSVTMCKAGKHLRMRGVLSGKPGEPTRVAGGPVQFQRSGDAGAIHQPDEVLSRQDVYLTICRDLRRDILNNIYKPGAMLPLMKQLQYRYRTSNRTLARALSVVCEEGLVVPCRRRYAVAVLSSAGSSRAIGLIAHRESVTKQVLSIPSGHNYLHHIELYASQLSIKTRLAGYEWEDGALDAEKVMDEIMPGGRNPPDGFIFIPTSQPSDFEELCKGLARTRKPVAVLDLQGDWKQTASNILSAHFRIFPIGVTPLSGDRMAQHLFGLGHRRIAFFSLWHYTPWSINRYAGMKRARADAGLEGDIRFFGTTTEARPSDEGPIVPLWDKPSDPADPESAEYVLKAAFNARYRDLAMVRRYARPLFEQALADPSITAWVSANDEIAVSALEFLREKRVAVPGRISLVSFDDSTAAIANRITSYNFQLERIVAAAFRHLLDFKRPQRLRWPRVVDIPGTIVTRQTSGPAPLPAVRGAKPRTR